MQIWNALCQDVSCLYAQSRTGQNICMLNCRAVQYKNDRLTILLRQNVASGDCLVQHPAHSKFRFSKGSLVRAVSSQDFSISKDRHSTTSLSNLFLCDHPHSEGVLFVFFLFYVEEKFPVFLVNSLFKFSKFPVYPVCTHWLSSCYSSPLRVWISHLYSFCQVLLHMDKNSLSLLVSTLNSPISFSLSFICQMLQSLNYHCGPSLNLSHFVYVSLVLESPA